jgi:hypothetical protein
MRFMVMIQADESNAAASQPNEKMFAAMGKYNEELVNAGVMLSGEGLLPSAKGARVTFGRGEPTVVDGPFTETKELLGGFWIWQLDSLDEAIEWVKRMPSAEALGIPSDTESTIEIRQIAEMEDFGEEFTPELREAEAELRAKLEARQQS